MNQESLTQTVNVRNQFVDSTISYDAAGNMTANGSNSYTYDVENRIATAAGSSYTYDGDGNRIKKIGATSTLYWGESFTGGPLEETDLSGTLRSAYVYFGAPRWSAPSSLQDRCRSVLG